MATCFGLEKGETGSGDGSESGGDGDNSTSVDASSGVLTRTVSGRGRAGSRSRITVSSALEGRGDLAVEEGLVASLTNGTGELLVGVVGEKSGVETVSAVSAESGLVCGKSHETLLLGGLIAQDGLDAGEGDRHLSDVLKHVHFSSQAVLSLRVLETTSIAKLVVRVDKVVDKGRDVGAVVGAKVRSTALKESAVGGRELVLGASSLARAADVVAEVVVETGDNGGVATAGKSTDGAGEGKTARDVGAGDDANETRGTARGETSDEGRVELGLSRAGETSDGSHGGNDGSGGNGAHLDRNAK